MTLRNKLLLVALVCTIIVIVLQFTVDVFAVTIFALIYCFCVVLAVVTLGLAAMESVS